MEVTLFWVPPESRGGPWQKRQWKEWEENGVVRKEVISPSEFICPVELQERALTTASLELLTLHGIPATTMPRRDSTLPAKRFG